MPPILRLVIFASVATLLLSSVHVYLYRRLFRDTTSNRLLRRVGMGLMLGLALSLVGARFIYTRLPPTWSLPYSITVWLWMGLATYLVLALVVLGSSQKLLRWGAQVWRRLAPERPQLAGGPGVLTLASAVLLQPPTPVVDLPAQAEVDPSRRLFLSRAVAGSALAFSSGLVGYGAFRCFSPPQLNEVALKLAGLPRALEGFRIVHLSDIHVGGIIEQRFMRELVGRCNALRPDLVVITGDLVDGDVPTLGPAVAELGGLRSSYGTYFCNGNHDFYSGVEEWNEALDRVGVTVLRNRFVRVGDSGGSFDLVGVDDWSQRRQYDLEGALKGRDPDRPAVLLAHQPQDFDRAVQGGVGLQLSGHTHGGQFFPGTVFSQFLWRYSAGHYPVGDRHIYVSRGTGFWGPPIRVGSGSEIALLNLLS